MIVMILFFLLGGVIFVAIFWFILKFRERLLKRLRKKYSPKKAHKFKCLDGHVVRSKGELMIDNHLHRLGIKHEYEQTIDVKDNPIKYDWYLPENEIYMEYWGFHGKDYMARKEEKIKLYKKGKLTLVSIEDVMLEDIYTNLEDALSKHMEINRTPSANKKFCPNCGTTLDERF